ncbi:unnamed protein product [Clavelina lepadiformis]|uniref:Uncharacterized protein n=1 Tax=Clavelina lepadiformis TaxID=159417 RepID=A0ABP0G5A6_CLALP
MLIAGFTSAGWRTWVIQAFLLPVKGRAGNKVVRLQQTPVDVSGGKIMSFNANEEIHFKNDPNLMQIFKKTENEFCKHSSSPTDFFGGKPCKSPYATYTVVVPKGNHTCSLDPNNWIDGSNCRRLNLTKLTILL